VARGRRSEMRGHEDQASGTLCRWKTHKGARASGRVVRARRTEDEETQGGERAQDSQTVAAAHEGA
jgi:hypothetical protein